MLCLARKLKETVVIGDDITITVWHLQKGRVKLLIDAPKNVKVLRGELLERPQEADTSEAA